MRGLGASLLQTAYARRAQGFQIYALVCTSPWRLIGFPWPCKHKMLVKDLKDYMRQAGEVTYADAHTRHRNEGIIEFATYSDMKNALDKLDNTEINGRKIRLVEDRAKKHSSRSRSRSRRKKSRSRSRSRRSRSRSRSRSDSRSRSVSKSRSKSGSKERRAKSDDKDKAGSKKKSKSLSRSRSPSHSKSKSRSKSRSPDDHKGDLSPRHNGDAQGKDEDDD